MLRKMKAWPLSISESVKAADGEPEVDHAIPPSARVARRPGPQHSSRDKGLDNAPADPQAQLVMVFRFQSDGRWNAERDAVEFEVVVGEYQGVVRVSRRVFHSLFGHRPTPQECVEAYYLCRTRLEMAAERKIRRRGLTEDGTVELTGRDLCER
jgi:uncharacterized protein DUF1488